MSYISRAGAGSVKASPTRSYMAVRSYNNDIFSYTVSTDNISKVRISYVTTGILGPVPGATAANCTQGNLLVETGKKLYPGANPGIITYMVGVFDSINGIHGYIDPNSSAFVVQNSDRPYYITSPGTGPVAGLTGPYPDRAPPVFTRGVVYGQSDLDISGNGHIYGNLIVESTFTAGIFTPSSMTVNGPLTVNGTTTLNSTLNVYNTATFYSTVNALSTLTATNISTTKDLYVAGNLNVSTATTLRGMLNVYNTATFYSTVNALSTLTATNISTTKNLYVAGNLNVSTATTLNGTLDVYNTATFYSTINALSTLNAASISTQNIYVSHNLNVSTATSLGGPLTAYSDATFLSTVTVASTLTAPYLTGVKTLSVSGSAAIGGDLSVSSFTTLSSCLAVYGDAQFYSTVTVASTLTAPYLTGVQTLGVSGSAYIGGALSVSSFTTLSSCLAVYGDAQFYSTVTVWSTLTTQNISTLNSVDISGALAVNGPTALFSSLTTYDSTIMYGNVIAYSSFATSTLTVTTGALQFPARIVGSAPLTAGATTVLTSAVTGSSFIFLTYLGPIINEGILCVKNIVPETSFDIQSDNGSDTNTVQWFIIN